LAVRRELFLRFLGWATHMMMGSMPIDVEGVVSFDMHVFVQ